MFRLSGCFLVCPKGDDLEAGSTRLEAVVEEWRPIATSSQSKLGVSLRDVKLGALSMEHEYNAHLLAALLSRPQSIS